MLRWALVLVWAIALPAFLIGTNVRWVTLDLSTYTTGFARLRTAERTGMAPAELERIAREFIEFFKGNRAEMQVQSQTPTGLRPLFNDREVHHMDDVRTLMRFAFRLQPVFGLLMLASLVVAIAAWRGAAVPSVQWMVYSGVASTLVLGILVAALSFLDFSALFLQFHMMSFSNDLWQLDPRTDYLLILFPEQFWLDTTMRLAWMTVLEVLAIGSAAYFLPRVATP